MYSYCPNVDNLKPCCRTNDQPGCNTGQSLITQTMPATNQHHEWNKRL